MFIIKENDIRDEFYSTSWEKDCDRYTSILSKVSAEVRDALSNNEPLIVPKSLTNEENSFTASFAHDMNNGLHFARNYADDLKGYLKIRDILSDAGMSPEALDYSILGNIEAGMLRDVEIDDDIDIDAIKTYGYVPKIVKIVSNEPNTVIYFNDGTKTVVKCADPEEFDIEKGVYFALLKKAYGSRNLQHIFKLIANAIGENKSSDTSAIDPDDLVPDDMESINIDNWEADSTAE